jgi:hypothetical protein
MASLIYPNTAQKMHILKKIALVLVDDISMVSKHSAFVNKVMGIKKAWSE